MSEPLPMLITDKFNAGGRACYFCYTGSEGVAEAYKSYDDGLARLVVDLLREGPEAPPTHQICSQCLKANKHRQRNRCQQCGKLASLLRTANDSMTNKWSDIGPEHIKLCEDCQVMLYNPETRSWMFHNVQMPYTSKVLLTDDDIALLRRLWREHPDWKTRTKLPPLHRRIDDD